MASKKPALADYGLLFLLALVFAASFSFTSMSLAHFPPLTVTAIRLLLASIITLPIMLLAKQKLPGKDRIWLYIFASAFFSNALPFSLIAWGQVTVSAGLTAIFMAIMPLATLMIAHGFTDDEKLNRWKLLGVFLGLLGVLVLIGFDSLKALGDQTFRQMAIVAAALCYAINAVITKKLVTLPKKAMICALMLAATLMTAPLSLLIDNPWTINPPLSAALPLLALAIGPTALATFMILIIIERQGASFLSQVNFLVPVFGVLLAGALLHESLPLKGYLALSIIMLGLALSRFGASKKNEKV